MRVRFLLVGLCRVRVAEAPRKRGGSSAEALHGMVLRVLHLYYKAPAGESIFKLELRNCTSSTTLVLRSCEFFLVSGPLHPPPNKKTYVNAQSNMHAHIPTFDSFGLHIEVLGRQRMRIVSPQIPWKHLGSDPTTSHCRDRSHVGFRYAPWLFPDAPHSRNGDLTTCSCGVPQKQLHFEVD